MRRPVAILLVLCVSAGCSGDDSSSAYCDTVAATQDRLAAVAEVDEGSSFAEAQEAQADYEAALRERQAVAPDVLEDEYAVLLGEEGDAPGAAAALDAYEAEYCAT